MPNLRKDLFPETATLFMASLTNSGAGNRIAKVAACRGDFPPSCESVAARRVQKIVAKTNGVSRPNFFILFCLFRQIASQSVKIKGSARVIGSNGLFDRTTGNEYHGIILRASDRLIAA